MLHAKSMAVVVAYDIYLECCDGLMRAGEWRQRNPVSFHLFREKLAKQMLLYNPKDRKYPGDERFRASTSQHKQRRPPLHTDLSNSASSGDSTMSSVTQASIKEASRKRLCGDLCPLIEHLSSIQQIPNRNSKVCVVCGKDCYHVCMKCVGDDGRKGVAMHCAPILTGRGHAGIPCNVHYHNTSFYGLARNDYRLAGVSAKKDWKQASPSDRQVHYRKIRRVLDTDRQRAHNIGNNSSNNSDIDDSSVNWNNVI